MAAQEKIAWISSAAAGSAVERVGSALTENIRRNPAFRKVYFNKGTGFLEEQSEGSAPTSLACGLDGFGKTAFLYSLRNRIPEYRSCFIDNQNLSFLEPPRACMFVHDLFYLTHPTGWFERLQGWMQYRGMGSYRELMVNSEYTKRCLLQRGIPEDRIHVFPLDYDRSVFRPDSAGRPGLRREIGVPENARMLFHVSSGEKRKNFPGILHAFALLVREMPDLYLVKAGRDLKAGNAPLAASLAGKLGITHRVRFLGAVDDRRLAELYQASECLVFPSFAEGFGLPVLEAQGCGCPVVTSRVTALQEVAGPLCVTVDPSSPEDIAAGIRRILEDKGMRERERAANEAWLTRFSWEPGRTFLEDFLIRGL